ncbi:MAG: SAM-dependent chlorinase/fluorinase [Spirochaetales bacterium]|nr:SAM-dependent chlorinase/fluorinase [Spirochaetales bacterium]
MKKIISLLTDFGLSDSYVGVMKGVMLKIDPDIRFVDITHSLSPFNITSASYLLFSAWDYFPGGTVFLSVVDPGVGTSRKTLLYMLNNKFLITPDNGTVSLLMRMHRNGQAFFVSDTTIEECRVSESATFHGRDIFAPLAASLVKNGLDAIRTEQGEPVLLDVVWPVIDEEKKRATGKILHIDRFGNCITSLHHTDVPRIWSKETCRVTAGTIIINGIHHCFSDVPKGNPLVYKGSSDFFEIAVREGNAASALHFTPHMDIVFDFDD